MSGVQGSQEGSRGSPLGLCRMYLGVQGFSRPWLWRLPRSSFLGRIFLSLVRKQVITKKKYIGVSRQSVDDVGNIRALPPAKLASAREIQAIQTARGSGNSKPEADKTFSFRPPNQHGRGAPT